MHHQQPHILHWCTHLLLDVSTKQQQQFFSLGVFASCNHCKGICSISFINLYPSLEACNSKKQTWTLTLFLSHTFFYINIYSQSHLPSCQFKVYLPASINSNSSSKIHLFISRMLFHVPNILFLPLKATRKLKKFSSCKKKSSQNNFFI